MLELAASAVAGEVGDPEKLRRQSQQQPLQRQWPLSQQRHLLLEQAWASQGRAEGLGLGSRPF